MLSLDVAPVEVVKEAFAFSVVKERLHRPHGLVAPAGGEATDMFGLFRNDNGVDVRGFSCSEEYTPHQTDDVIALVEAASEAWGGIDNVECHFRKGHFVKIQPSEDKRKAIFGTEDNIYPRLVISAPYNGKSFKGIVALLRDTCMNMTQMTKVHGTSVAIRHSGNLREHMDELIENFGRLLEGWDKLGEAIVEMEARRVNLAVFIAGCFGELKEDAGKKAKTVWRERFEAIRTRIAKERILTRRPALDEWDNPTVSAWEAYNGVQGYVQWETVAAKKSQSDFERALKAGNHPAVKKAEALALA